MHQRYLYQNNYKEKYMTIAQQLKNSFYTGIIKLLWIFLYNLNVLLQEVKSQAD